MTVAIRRLGPGDEQVLAVLAKDEADFGLDDGGGPSDPLPPQAASALLGDPHVLHWIAEDGGLVVGHIFCHLLRKRAGAGHEVLLYDIGVRAAHRRQGIGRALVGSLTDWMNTRGIKEAWVVADGEGAVELYEACGFKAAENAPTYMALELGPHHVG